LKRGAIGLGVLLGLLLVVGLGALLWLRSRVQANLPEVRGERRLSGLSAPATIERDALGVPNIQGSSRRDVAFATGFAHAQDRLFQMDLLRRLAAGELATIFGAGALPNDKAIRPHRFRAQAEELLRSSSPEVRDLLEAYAAGVNAGRASLGGKPFEYVLTRTEPAPWRPEDSYLVLLAMFIRLQDENGAIEAQVTRMRHAMPEALYHFLDPDGTEWDAPMQGAPFAAAPVPGPDVCNLRTTAKTSRLAGGSEGSPREREPLPGSSGWAVAGDRTAYGSALLANELHLELGVPNYWYRASLSWPEGAGRRRVTGVTLPGTPAIVLGSNGEVAWGITNSAMDSSDLVPLEVDPAKPELYATPEGPRRFTRYRETIQVKGGEAETVDVDWTIWGPVIGPDDEGHLHAVRWVPHEPGGANFEILGLETVHTVGEALAVAHRSGVPALNFLVADAGGHIAWSILGRIPKRGPGFDGQATGSWQETAQRWQGLLPPEEVPQIVDPPSGRVWNANNRSVDGEMLAKLGGGSFVFGARGRQIRDDLMALDKATVEDMRGIQLDDRAVFLSHWRDLLMRALTPQAVAADPRRAELRALVESWGGHAAVNSAGYRLVRVFRTLLGRRVFHSILAGCSKMPADFEYFGNSSQEEGPLWRLVTEQPVHLLDPRYATWQDVFLATIDEMFEALPPGPLRDRTWGERNTTMIQHPLSRGVPFIGRWLDMPHQALPGDADMPRVQSPSWGATVRMVVSPGREAEGFINLPGGQSGNPLSHHYHDGHAAWAEGRATPFLPGPPVDTLRLLPDANR
jgi:penicillin amidase